MLQSVNLDDRTYEELFAEALSQIPLYSREWTNFNVSDPGVTILQNLTSFNVLQQSHINEVTEKIRRSLLKLLGYEARENAPARVLLGSLAPCREELPAHARLMAGDLCFETAGPVCLQPWELTAVYVESEGEFRDITYLLDRDIAAGAAVFGAPARAGAALYCILTGPPPDDPLLLLYAHIHGAEARNPVRPGHEPDFASVRWQFHTVDGWVDLLVEDETHAFLHSGEIRMILPDEAPAVFAGAPVRGYALRCVLDEERYDLAPRLHCLTANLIEVVQRETLARTFVLDGYGKLVIHSQMTGHENLFVFCREAAGEPYRAYREYSGIGETGRFYETVRELGGALRIIFDKKRFEYGPSRSRSAVLVTMYDHDMLHHRSLGEVLGYDGQVFDVDFAQWLLPESFSLLARIPGPDADSYHLIPPGETAPDTLGYELLSEHGQVCIYNAGLGEACEIFVADCAVTAGAQGNVREDSRFVFEPTSGDGALQFRNPAAGSGGVTRETVEQLRTRFASDLHRPTSAVYAEDYEELIHQTPGLCIHKVKAVVDGEGGRVKIAVKPRAETGLPLLSPLYLRQIRRWTEPHRMLATQVDLVQPRYVAVNVQAAVCVKSYYDNPREEIEALLRTELDTVNGPHNFGEKIVYHRLVELLEALSCVRAVKSLSLLPQSRGDVAFQGLDLCPASHCLCYPGEITLDLTTQGS